ncbi:MAG: efflux RND transporter periplasmic adaptor subunit [Saprospiraceae bacterium]|nr:efflux RND transporter periplasmic adaptor subunit [Saprospiraceae bacterium]
MTKISFLLLLAVCTTFVACGGKNDQAADAATATDSLRTRATVTEVLGIAVVEPSERIINLSAEKSGYIREVKARIGDKVKKGQLLLTLDAEIENAQLTQANSKLGTQNQAIEAALQNLKLLQVKLDKARADLSRDEALFKGNALTQQQLDNTRALIPDLEQQIKVQETLVKQEEGRARELRADVVYYQTLAEQKTVRAPMDGQILSIDARVGQFLDSQTGFAEFAPVGPIMAITEIDEMFADRIRLGQQAYIRPQGSSEILARGKVVLMSPYLRKKSLFADSAGDPEDRRVREVRVQLDDPEGLLIGSRVECIIQL